MVGREGTKRDDRLRRVGDPRNFVHAVVGRLCTLEESTSLSIALGAEHVHISAVSHRARTKEPRAPGWIETEAVSAAEQGGIEALPPEVVF